MSKLKNNKAFTLIELIVVISVLGTLVLLAAPRFMGHVENAKVAQIQNDVRVAENAVEIEMIDDNDFTEDLIVIETSDMENRRDLGHLFHRGGPLSQDETFDGEYFEVDDLIKTELDGDFIMSQGGKVFYYDEEMTIGNEGNSSPNYTEHVASDDDFEWVDSNLLGTYYNTNGDRGYFNYIGEGQEIVEIPHTIKGVEMTSYHSMFQEADKDVEKIISTNENIEDMSHMFRGSQATELDLTDFDTSNVTDMFSMFRGSQVEELILSSFDTSNVTNMNSMFSNFQATELDLSSFDTSNVTHMISMFESSRATKLDLSSFDTSNVSWTRQMFQDSEATSGLARTQDDADKFNNSANKPEALTFTVK